MIISITAAIIFGLALAHYKWALGRTTLETKTFLAVHFLALFGFACLGVIKWGHFTSPLFGQARYLWLLAIVVVLGIVNNYFLARGFKRESLHEYELIDLLMPIFTVSMAALAFVDEREPVRLTLALIGASAFLLTHIRHHQINFKQADRWLVYAVFLMAMERIFVKPLLVIIDPFSLYAVRTGLIAAVFLLLFRPRLARVPVVEWLNLSLNALLGVAAMVLTYTSISLYGVVITELYLLITPIVLATISWFFFRDRWTLTQAGSFVLILACIFLMNRLL